MYTNYFNVATIVISAWISPIKMTIVAKGKLLVSKVKARNSTTKVLCILKYLTILISAIL